MTKLKAGTWNPAWMTGEEGPVRLPKGVAVIDDVVYAVKITRATISVRSVYDSFQFEYYETFRTKWVTDGVEKYAHERMMRKRSGYSKNPLSSAQHRDKLINYILGRI